MRFIHVTNGNVKYIVNVEQIVCLEAASDRQFAKNRIYFPGTEDNLLNVDQTPDEILFLISHAYNT